MKKYKSMFFYTSIVVIVFTTTSYLIHKPVKQRYVEVVATSLPKTVTINVDVSYHLEKSTVTKYGRISGSGVFISKNGHILSCAHLFDAKEFKICGVSVENSDGWIYSAEVLIVDSKRDLSLVKISENNTPFVLLAKPGSTELGEEVIAIGSPLHLPGTVTTGVISALNRDEIKYDMVQMSAPINPGNSGGPLFNLKGELVGINVNIFSLDPVFPSWSGIGFSVSPSEINKFLVTYRAKYQGV